MGFRTKDGAVQNCQSSLQLQLVATDAKGRTVPQLAALSGDEETFDAVLKDCLKETLNPQQVSNSSGIHENVLVRVSPRNRMMLTNFVFFYV